MIYGIKIPDLIIGLITAGIILAALIITVRKRKNGCSCCKNCSGCSNGSCKNNF